MNYNESTTEERHEECESAQCTNYNEYYNENYENYNESTTEEQHDECESAQCTKVSVPNIQCHFQSLNSALQDEVQRIEAKRQEVESQEKALNEERQRMMQILVKDDDVISLNIGGKNMAASRSTLC